MINNCLRHIPINSLIDHFVVCRVYIFITKTWILCSFLIKNLWKIMSDRENA
jgi:hypothetical protein